MASKSFHERVTNNMFSVNETEDEIISYLESHSGELTTVRDTAKLLNITPNTIIRLSKKLGYNGWAEMKFDMSHGESYVSQSISFAIPFDSEISDNLSATISSLDHADVERVVKKIEAADTTVVFGIGDSRFMGELLVKYLRMADKSKQVQLDSDFTINNLNPKDVAIFISYSGETAAVLKQAGNAKARGATIVSITVDNDNSLRGISDYNFHFNKHVGGTTRLDGYAPDLTGMYIIIRHIANTYQKHKVLM